MKKITKSFASIIIEELSVLRVLCLIISSLALGFAIAEVETGLFYNENNKFLFFICLLNSLFIFVSSEIEMKLRAKSNTQKDKTTYNVGAAIQILSLVWLFIIPELCSGISIMMFTNACGACIQKECLPAKNEKG